MKLKIKSSEIISARVSGTFYYEVQKRALAQKMSINDYVKNAVAKHMDFKEDNDNGTKPT
jgi:predicted HicB family RNase H-like nuclease